MTETTFENAKVGDNVWEITLGRWGQIKSIHHSVDYPILVLFSDGSENSYTFKGRSFRPETQPQQLFYDEVQLDLMAPPRQKRKVVKTVERWLNIFSNGTTYISKTKGDADLDSQDTCGANDIERIACVHLTGTYEVEE